VLGAGIEVPALLLLSALFYSLTIKTKWGEGMLPDDNKGWNPYLAGSLSGLLIVASVWLSGKYFGASTTFVRTAGMLESLVVPERVANMPYFLKEQPMIDWQWLFVAGIFLGAWLAARLCGDFRWQAVPLMWEQRFGPGLVKRGLAAFAGGAVAMFGARLADG
jgi:hypothetical protein